MSLFRVDIQPEAFFPSVIPSMSVERRRAEMVARSAGVAPSRVCVGVVAVVVVVVPDGEELEVVVVLVAVVEVEGASVLVEDWETVPLTEVVAELDSVAFVKSALAEHAANRNEQKNTFNMIVEGKLVSWRPIRFGTVLINSRELETRRPFEKSVLMLRW